MPNLGKTDIGGSSVSLGSGTYFGVHFTAGESGPITEMSVYIYDKQSATKFRLAIWSAQACADTDNGRPYEKLGESGETDIADGWVSAAVSAEITSGQVYFLMFKADAQVALSYDSDTDSYKTFKNTGQTWGPFPTSIPGPGHVHEARAYSIYATYTTGVQIYTKTWQTDTLFKKLGITKTAVVDAAFKNPDITKTFALDAALQKRNIQVQKQVDALFKKLDLLKQFGVDVDFLKKDILKGFAIDARFGALMTHEISRQVDALFKRLGITKTFGLDTAVQKRDIILQKQVDVLFRKSVTMQRQCDTLFKKYGAEKTLAVDVWFGGVTAQTYTKTFSLDAMFRYKLKLPTPLGITLDGQLVIPINKEVWIGN